MRKYIAEEWKGLIFGHLEIIDYDYGQRMFKVRCDCGREKYAKPSFLFNRKMVCCGLDCKYHQEGYDKRTRHRLYTTWRNMIARCENPNSVRFKYYGGRGITVCDEWRNDFWAFAKWGEENGYEEGLTIDRIDCDGWYSPENCRWATYKEQNNNQHKRYTFTDYKYNKGKLYEMNGEKKTLAYWCDKYGILEQTVRYRLKCGLPLEEALTKAKWQKNPEKAKV